MRPCYILPFRRFIANTFFRIIFKFINTVLYRAYKLSLVLAGCLLFMHPLQAQDIDTTEVVPPKIFLNCAGECFEDFVKTEIPLLNFVRDQAQADIQVVIISKKNASGGQLFTLTFIGQNDFDALVDTLTFTTRVSDTQSIMQEQLIATLKYGLIRYLARTNLISQIKINFNTSGPNKEKEAIEMPDDKWNYWVFTVDAKASFEGESNRQSVSLNNSIFGRRITEKSRISTLAYYNYSREKFNVNDKRITANFADYGFNGRYVRSFTEHWSGGAIYTFFYSKYSNFQASHQIAPAVEYNLFPYSESIQQQFRVAYQVGYRYASFIQETIYDRMYQNIPYQKLSVILDFTKTWGNINTSLDASTFLSNFRRNNFALNTNLTIRLVEGLSLTLFGSASLINDQISLAKEDASDDAFLLGARQLPTNFKYFTEVGLSYTFGSINNSIVNVRLDQIE